MAAMQAEIREIQRDTDQKFADIMATLARDERILQALPETIQQKIGFTSVRIIEKHYAPWDKAWQDRLEEDVRKSGEGEEKQRSQEP